jgi:hypothetical protein
VLGWRPGSVAADLCCPVRHSSSFYTFPASQVWLGGQGCARGMHGFFNQRTRAAHLRIRHILQLAASAERQAEAERQHAAARAEAARSASERDELQKKLVWWQQELESAQAEADLYAKAAKAARLEASRAAAALKEGFSAAAAAFARGLERSGSLAASESAPPSASKRSARRWCAFGAYAGVPWLPLGPACPFKRPPGAAARSATAPTYFPPRAAPQAYRGSHRGLQGQPLPRHRQPLRPLSALPGGQRQRPHRARGAGHGLVPRGRRQRRPPLGGARRQREPPAAAQPGGRRYAGAGPAAASSGGRRGAAATARSVAGAGGDARSGGAGGRP